MRACAKPKLRFGEGRAAVADLAPDPLVPPELGDPAGPDRFLDEAVCPAGVDADEAAPDAQELPGVVELAHGVAGSGQPDLRAGLVEPRHGAGVGTMGADHRAVDERDVGEKPLGAS